MLAWALLWSLPCFAQGGAGGQGKGAPQAAPVLAATATVESIPELVSVVGNAEAASVVEIKARINGELVQAHFEEGQEVRQGDVLFTIDPRPLEAALREAKAKLERNQALLRKAEEDNRRYAQLVNERIISREQFEEKTTNLAALLAQVKADAATVESAEVELTYSSIRSPINGRTGQILVDRGNMIKANDVAMLVIQQIEPIHVQFSVPEALLGEIMARYKAAKLEVRAAPPGREQDPDVGVLVFIDNTVDRKTGSIALKASFENREHRLWPGQFVNVQLVLGVRDRVVTVPSQAVMPSSQGEAVYVIREDNTAEFRPVKTDVRLSAGLPGKVAVESGLSGGERVVVDGHLRLAPGRPVDVRGGVADGGGGGVIGSEALNGKAGGPQ
ncbi:putative efflux transporter protein [Megalodesulfovibrio gigas DSM 1382 = ATCC 19364]|uniref:Putative efflux transporter protein n=1 Tax=Megalodesulfovibrio gigas (strain ATCC 19364 / DSM 1382 / NCIMB 9332 / VKM B-1759) TaxID=1121448 RepID=T2G837_MEGG1|nr:putative efflux transporter protein [Megalodesulfovibrio gigas DSM 1382 = ATCC 19364]